MDEKALAEMVREVVREELSAFRQEVATKEDLRAFATKEVLEKLRSEMATKEDLKAFATKEDLKAFATKEDFANFLLRFDARMKQFQEGVQLMPKEYGNDIQEIKLKLSLEYGSYSSVMSLIEQAVGIIHMKIPLAPPFPKGESHIPLFSVSPSLAKRG